MVLSFITERSESILSRAKFPSESFNVLNANKCFDEAQVTLWKSLAAAFGVDLAETEYTIRAVTKGADRNLYTPYIGSNGTEAILVWGKVQKPVKDFDKSLVELSLGGGKRPALECFIPALEDTIVLTLMIAKGDTETSTPAQKKLAATSDDEKKNVLRLALRTNKLHEYLSQSFERAKKLGDVAGQTMTVTGYTLNRFGKYELQTNLGLVAGNTAVSKKLDKSPVITKDAPATLEVGHSSGKTSTGFDIYPVIITTQADRDLPVFDFGAEDNLDSNLDFVDGGTPYNFEKEEELDLVF